MIEDLLTWFFIVAVIVLIMFLALIIYIEPVKGLVVAGFVVACQVFGYMVRKKYGDKF